MTLYKLTRGTMDDSPTPKLPIHLELGFGLLHVDACMVIDCFRAGLSKNKVQVAIHSYGQATGKKFKTHSTLDDDDCITVKRIK